MAKIPKEVRERTMGQDAAMNLRREKYMTKQQKIIKEELQEPQYIGEDGGMVISREFNQQEAYKKMVEKVRQDCEEGEAEDFIDWCKIDDLGIGWLHLVTEKNSERFEPDTEWYVSIRDKSPYSVWVYWG